MPDYLSHEEILALNKAVLDAEMANTSTRDYLLQNINRGYVAQLPSRDNDYFQIQSDLSRLNVLPYLEGEDTDTFEVPLQIWLMNGVAILRMQYRPEKRIFQEALDKVTAKSDEVIAEVKGEAPAPVSEVPEKIVHTDDLLAYRWLEGAVKVGGSVARLLVPRYENGQLRKVPGKDEPVIYFGTGWLIGEQYVITNHHVVNARSETEPYASEADLHKQSQETVVQFQYDTSNVEGDKAEVESLEAWWFWNDDPKLDYAILKLKTPSTRMPLTLSPQALKQLKVMLDQPELGKPAVNLVQHPGGGAKMLGIRNNLVNIISENKIEYFTDTMRGSSGSPVCDDDWNVVGLHRATGKLGENIDFQGKPIGYANNGVPIDRIIQDLKDNHGDLWQAIGAKMS